MDKLFKTSFRFIIRFLQILSLPVVFPYFLLSFLACLITSKNYESLPYNYPPEIRFKKVYRLVSMWLYIKGIKVVTVNDKIIPKKPVLVVANHKSNLDPLVLIKAFGRLKNSPPLTFVAKIELKDTVLFKLMKLIDCVFIDRKNIRQIANALETQQQLIRQGTAIAVFAEGTRILSNDIGEFKSGALKVAYNAFVPILPVSIVGSLGKMESNKRLKEHGVKKSSNYEVKVIFNKLINPISFNQIDSNNLANNIRSIISDAYTSEKPSND